MRTNQICRYQATIKSNQRIDDPGCARRHDVPLSAFKLVLYNVLVAPGKGIRYVSLIVPQYVYAEYAVVNNFLCHRTLMIHANQQSRLWCVCRDRRHRRDGHTRSTGSTVCRNNVHCARLRDSCLAETCCEGQDAFRFDASLPGRDWLRTCFFQSAHCKSWRYFAVDAVFSSGNNFR